MDKHKLQVQYKTARGTRDFSLSSVWTWTIAIMDPIAESHCLIDPSATLGFAILASPRVLRKAKGKQNCL